MADPERFDEDPDPTFQTDADPNPFTRVRNEKLFSSNLHQSLPKLVMCNFLSKKAGGRVRDKW